MYRLDLTLMTPDRARCAQSVCQLFHGPAPRSPLRRLSFLLRRSRFNTGTSLPRRRGLVPSMMPYSRACWPCLCLLLHLGRQISKKDIPMRYPSHKLKISIATHIKNGSVDRVQIRYSGSLNLRNIGGESAPLSGLRSFRVNHSVSEIRV